MNFNPWPLIILVLFIIFVLPSLFWMPPPMMFHHYGYGYGGGGLGILVALIVILLLFRIR